VEQDGLIKGSLEREGDSDNSVTSVVLASSSTKDGGGLDSTRNLLDS
jgi:hypothetical protein